ncbi:MULTISPECIES: hypothetical protein [unclassified Marinitoga]|uniref:hypothetical protein n=1 Tax=unclassified Marinitoga TaxID=2640159 RepID=UPI0006410D72|nr:MULTISPECIES: hypothetical protein [unclassified Marinitoga]KLO24697.1 hypothetical protein X274_03140 [Marinitoga sp. 1155]NUU98814.1 hypothetical protein [Marinitoga sp. 1154]
MKNKLFFLLFIIITVYNFSSAKLLFPDSIDFYYQRSKNINSGILYTGIPLFFIEDNNYKSNILFEFPLGFEKRLENNVLFNGGGYYTLEKDKIFFSDLYNEYYSWMNFGFEFYHNDNLYARFIVDFKEGNSAYFKYKNLTFLDIYNNFELIKRTTLDTPSLSYLSLKNNNWSFILGRTRISLGPLKNSLILSDATKYYENINYKYRFKGIIFNTILISMQPMLTKEEYEKQFSTDATDAFREILTNRVDFNFDKINIGVTSLNLYGGSKALIDTKNGLISIDALLQYKNFRLYVQDTYNTFKDKNSYGYGAEILFKIHKDTYFSMLYENYFVDNGIYEDEIPYNRLYNRSLEIINEPGARYFYDYPLGFKYDENSKVQSFQTYISNRNFLMLYEQDSGISFGNDFFNEKIKMYIRFFNNINVELKYINLRYDKQKFENYSVFLIIPIKIQ